MTGLTHITADAELRRDAEVLSQGLPPLLADARKLAATVQFGLHGRRRAGQGDEFWQYRPALPGDEARAIDWRRSGRSDQHFLREREWQAAQSVQFWSDGSGSMSFRSSAALPEKRDRARLLTLSLAILLERAGERIGFADGQTPPRAGQTQLNRMAEALVSTDVSDEYGVPNARALMPGSRAIFLSDFMGEIDAVERAVEDAAEKGVTGALVQVIDPAEVEFPFAGRAIFESMGGSLRHETREALGLRARYVARLAERQDRLERLARLTGWTFLVHRTDSPAQAALLWLYSAIGQQR